MAETKARTGFGAKFYVEASPFGAGAMPLITAMKLVGELGDLAEPERSKDAVEATHMASPSGYREFISGLRDGGEIAVPFSTLAADDGQLALDLAFDYDGAVYWALQIPTNPVMQWSGKGILTGKSGDVPMEDKMAGQATLKITGKPTLAAVV
ncbi:tail protein [Caulobacter phage W2]|uniref:Tail protein n=2 Tax=Kronosvirus TaxID=3425745 RepID=A0A386KRM0_9CAUD|nr:tail protein [Caulobacter phage Kronos]WDS38321.1 tail protein [Caulobacter phage TMCBR4]WDS38380.1 tail protein [Caulobacter phage W2]